MNLFFIYGTLKSDSAVPMAVKLRGQAEIIGEAHVYGNLYDMGDYPGLIVPNGELKQKVYGELYRVRDQELKDELDEYEGVPYLFERQLIQAHMPYKSVVAWAYIYRRPVTTASLIQSGLYTM